MKRPNDDVAGDAVASARQVAEYWYSVGQAIGGIDRFQENGHVDQPELYELRIKCDQSDPEGFMIMVKGLGEDGYVIAFHRGETVVEALVGVARRLQNHTLKWKVDQYANDK